MKASQRHEDRYTQLANSKKRRTGVTGRPDLVCRKTRPTEIVKVSKRRVDRYTQLANSKKRGTRVTDRPDLVTGRNRESKQKAYR